MRIKNYIETLVKNAQLRFETELLQIFGETSILFTWARRLSLYFAFYVVTISLHLYFKRFDWWHTDIERTRALLGALVTGEAAILAIVVSLSLVAVQLAASSYSARVIEVFRKAPDLWILIGVYGIAMFYGLWALNQTNSLDTHMAFSYYLGIFAFVALGPYIWKTLDMLKPSVAINILAKEINKKNMVSAVQGDNETMGDGITSFTFLGYRRVERDPILPIIDIVRSSLMKFDSETAKEGLKAIRSHIDYVLYNETFTSEEERRISIYIFEHLTGVCKLAASKNDETSIAEVINSMQMIGIRGAMRELTVVTPFSALYLKKIFYSLRFFQFESSFRKVVDSLEFIGSTAANRRFEVGIESAVVSLEEVGLASAMHNQDNAVVVTQALERLLEGVKTRNLTKVTQQIEDCIKKINEAKK